MTQDWAEERLDAFSISAMRAFLSSLLGRAPEVAKPFLACCSSERENTADAVSDFAVRFAVLRAKGVWHLAAETDPLVRTAHDRNWAINKAARAEEHGLSIPIGPEFAREAARRLQPLSDTRLKRQGGMMGTKFALDRCISEDARFVVGMRLPNHTKMSVHATLGFLVGAQHLIFDWINLFSFRFFWVNDGSPDDLRELVGSVEKIFRCGEETITALHATWPQAMPNRTARPDVS